MSINHRHNVLGQRTEQTIRWSPLDVINDKTALKGEEMLKALFKEFKGKFPFLLKSFYKPITAAESYIPRLSTESQK